jgi:hypothetical protein
MLSDCNLSSLWFSPWGSEFGETVLVATLLGMYGMKRGCLGQARCDKMFFSRSKGHPYP